MQLARQALARIMAALAGAGQVLALLPRGPFLEAAAPAVPAVRPKMGPLEVRGLRQPRQRVWRGLTEVVAVEALERPGPPGRHLTAAWAGLVLNLTQPMVQVVGVVEPAAMTLPQTRRSAASVEAMAAGEAAGGMPIVLVGQGGQGL